MKYLLYSSLVIAVFTGSADSADPKPIGQTFFKTYCIDCHGRDTQEGRFRADTLSGEFESSENAARWRRVIMRLEAGEMPPPDESARPTAVEVQQLLLSAKQQLAKTAREHRAAGRVRIRRLNRLEYENTVRDLLQIDTPLQDLLPEDDLADGFSNNAEALSISPVHIHQYMAAADRALQEATVHQNRPEAKTYRFSYSHETEKPFHGHAHNKLLCNLRGEDLYFFGPTHIEVPAYMRQFAAVTKQTPGRYRIKVTTEAKDTTDNEDLVYSVWLAAGGKRRKLLGHFDARFNKPTAIEITHHFDRNQTIIIAPYRMSKVRNDAGYSVYHPGKPADTPKGWHHINNPNPPIPSSGPAIVVKPVEITGPLIESWPPPGHRLLYGDVQLVPANEGSKTAGAQPAKAESAKLARRQVAVFMERAFRRPVSDEEIDVYFALVGESLEKGERFEAAMNAAHRAVLCSPDFLFLVQDKPVLDDYQLAVRLSYFLWRTSPDVALYELAAKGELSKPAVLRRETQRLIASPQFEAFVADFLDHWLNLREMDATTPDRDLYPEYFTSVSQGRQDRLLHDSLVKESRTFFRDVVQRNLRVDTLVRSRHAFLNERLTEHYDLPSVRGVALRRVNLPADSVRGGLLTQASVLKVTANGANTSPVIRGVWLLERILGTPAPPPPPDAGSIEPDTRGATTIREQLAKHKSDASCARCHQKIDPPGFALEAFDPIGRYREFYRTTETGEKLADRRAFFGSGYRPVKYLKGSVVDASSTLPDATTVSDIRQFKDVLARKPELIARNLVAQLVAFATGKPIEPGDLLARDQIVARTKNEQYAVRSLLHELIQSELFRNK